MSAVWCVAECRHGKLVGTIFELLTAGRRLADKLREPLCAVILGGPGIASLASEVAERGADKVYVLEHPSLVQFMDDAYSLALKSLAEKEKPRQILLPASVYGRSLAPRLSVALKSGLSSDATELNVDGSGHLAVTRSCYAGNLVATVSIRQGPEIATVRPLAFPRSQVSGKKGEIVKIPVDPALSTGRTEFVGFKVDESKEIDLSAAEKIVSGGYGLGNPEGFSLIRDLAHALGAAVGASRRVVDAGWIPYKHQVGLTGRSVRPKLYVACGISGQIQHLAGMKSAEVIVAINTDSECPMMKLATYAVQGDIYKIIPALISELRRARGEATPQASGTR